jgi:RNA polymerase sigma factor for flagellar operon FliA
MPKVNREKEREVWSAHRSGPSAATRQRVLEFYLPLVCWIARSMVARKYRQIDTQDMVQAGMVGLSQALDRFDPSRGVMFNTFATPRDAGRDDPGPA